MQATDFLDGDKHRGIKHSPHRCTMNNEMMLIQSTTSLSLWIRKLNLLHFLTIYYKKNKRALHLWMKYSTTIYTTISGGLGISFRYVSCWDTSQWLHQNCPTARTMVRCRYRTMDIYLYSAPPSCTAESHQHTLTTTLHHKKLHPSLIICPSKE